VESAAVPGTVGPPGSRTRGPRPARVECAVRRYVSIGLIARERTFFFTLETCSRLPNTHGAGFAAAPRLPVRIGAPELDLGGGTAGRGPWTSRSSRTERAGLRCRGCSWS